MEEWFAKIIVWILLGSIASVILAYLLYYFCGALPGILEFIDCITRACCKARSAWRRIFGSHAQPQDQHQLWPCLLALALVALPFGAGAAPEPSVPAAAPHLHASAAPAGGQAASQPAARPRRIVSLAPSLTEILFALGCGSRIAGRSTFSTWPPEAQKIPDVGAYNRPSAEAVAALRPDLCLALRDGTPERTVETLRRMRIPVLVADIRSFETLAEAVVLIGKAVGAEEKARAEAERFMREVQSLRRAPAPDAPRVIFQLQRRPVIAAGPRSFAGSLLEAAGVRNAVQGAAALYPMLGREDLLLLAPDAVIIAGMGDPKLDELAARDWQGKARVFTVDSDLFTRPSLRSADALRQLTRLLDGIAAQPDAAPQ